MVPKGPGGEEEMKLIANILCRRRYKAQTRFKRWFWNKKEKMKNLIIYQK